jgi:hypothetical protein
MVERFGEVGIARVVADEDEWAGRCNDGCLRQRDGTLSAPVQCRVAGGSFSLGHGVSIVLM